jgi:hypothetical protein
LVPVIRRQVHINKTAGPYRRNTGMGPKFLRDVQPVAFSRIRSVESHCGGYLIALLDAEINQRSKSDPTARRGSTAEERMACTTPRWSRMDSNFRYAGAVNLVVALFCRRAPDGSVRPSQFSDSMTPCIRAFSAGSSDRPDAANSRQAATPPSGAPARPRLSVCS